MCILAYLEDIYKCVTVMPSAQRRLRVLLAQIASRQVCIDQYIRTGSKPARRVSLAPRRDACSVHAAYV